MSNRTHSHTRADQSAHQTPDLRYALYLMDTPSQEEARRIRERLLEGETELIFPCLEEAVEKIERFMHELSAAPSYTLGNAAIRVLKPLLPDVEIVPLKRAKRSDCVERVSITNGEVIRHWMYSPTAK